MKLLRESPNKTKQKMRQKCEQIDLKSFKCCLCCHVRVGTIILGLWHLIVHLLVIGCLVTSLLHPEMLRDVESGTSQDTDGVLVLEKSGGDNSDQDAVLEIEYETPSYTQFRREDSGFAFALVMCTFMIALMMVYGAVRHRGGYLMPFFCLQVFDFCITCLTVVGYMTYTPDIKRLIVSEKLSEYPGMDKLMNMDDQWLMILFVLIFVLILSVKAYLINMVWSCYKYIQLRNVSRSVVREYRVDPDTEMLLPPKYEEAMRMKATEVPSGPPPPPYTG